MTNTEKAAFDAGLNELCEKYRIKVFCGFYISFDGVGERSGMTAAGHKPGPEGFAKLMAISPRMLAMMDEVNEAF